MSKVKIFVLFAIALACANATPIEEWTPSETLVETAPVPQELVETAPVHQELVETAPVYQELVETAPVHQELIETAPVHQELIEIAPVHQEELIAPITEETRHEETIISQAPIDQIITGQEAQTAVEAEAQAVAEAEAVAEAQAVAEAEAEAAERAHIEEIERHHETFGSSFEQQHQGEEIVHHQEYRGEESEVAPHLEYYEEHRPERGYEEMEAEEEARRREMEERHYEVVPLTETDRFEYEPEQQTYHEDNTPEVLIDRLQVIDELIYEAREVLNKGRELDELLTEARKFFSTKKSESITKLAASGNAGVALDAYDREAYPKKYQKDYYSKNYHLEYKPDNNYYNKAESQYQYNKLNDYLGKMISNRNDRVSSKN